MSEKSLDIRDQIIKEIENKAKHCANSTYECTLQRIDGYDYCIKHILRDNRSNYRQCNFVFKNGKKCFNALPNNDQKKDSTMTTFCFEHSRQTQLRKTHTTIGRFHHLDSNETLLNGLAHHIKIQELEEKAKISEQEEEIDVVSADAMPFSLVTQAQNLGAVRDAQKKRRRILDYASDSSVGENIPTFSNTFQEHHYNETDDESDDSVDEDLLRNAEVYTSEEVISIALKKYTKLKSLYESQSSYLQHLLKEKRRRYLSDVRKERETLCSIHDQAKDNPKERQAYEHFKALNSYHRRHGQEAALYKKFKEKRSRFHETYGQKAPGFVKCVHSEGGVKCRERVIPCSKYCRKHILEDKKQVLFRPCNIERGGVVCQEPVPCIFEDSACALHTVIPVNKQFIPKKFDSESDEEELIRHENADAEEEKKVKVEYINPEATNKLTENPTEPFPDATKKEIKSET